MANSPASRAALLTIGDELLLGEITDTNKPWLSQRLLPLGFTVCRSETVGDEMGEIVDAFHRAMACADLVLVTGGLGPTDDDLTSEGLAKALGLELEFRDEVMEQMAARLKRPIAVLSGGNRKQALLPKSAFVLKNDWGTAPGIHVVTANGKHIFLMPGVPREMKGLMQERIEPILRERFPSGRVILMKKLHAYGIPESTVGDRIKTLMQPDKNPDVGTRVGGGVVTVRLVAQGESEAAATAAMAPALEQVRQALSEGLFGEDDETIADATLKALIAKKLTVATAESCTAGWVASMLASVPGSSAALLEGAIVYSNAAKMRLCGVKQETLDTHGAVSKETAIELATGIRERSGADIGVSVTGIAGPGGGSEAKPVGLVYFGIATATGAKALERKFVGLDRNIIRERASTQALDLLRRAAIEI